MEKGDQGFEVTMMNCLSLYQLNRQRKSSKDFEAIYNYIHLVCLKLKIKPYTQQKEEIMLMIFIKTQR